MRHQQLLSATLFLLLVGLSYIFTWAHKPLSALVLLGMAAFVAWKCSAAASDRPDEKNNQIRDASIEPTATH
jgi:hypothetical protein